LSLLASNLLKAYDPDTIEEISNEVNNAMKGQAPDEIEKIKREKHAALIEVAAAPFTGKLNELLENIRKVHEQIIDEFNTDRILFAGPSIKNHEIAENIVNDFRTWIDYHRNEIEALQIFYGQPYQRRDLTFSMVRELSERLIADKPSLAPLHVWRAYEQLEKANGSPKDEITALVSLIRRIAGIDNALTSFDLTVDRNFKDWIFRKQAGALKFNEEQMNWLRMIKDHIASSVHLEYDDLDYTPFNASGGKGKMWQLFGSESEKIIAEMNEFLAA
jgi:type I restriction enzyme R subunit